MKRCALAGVLLLASAATFADDRRVGDRPIVIVVVGAEGTEEYGRQFREWAGRWAEAAQQGRAELTTLGLEAAGGDTDRDLLQKRLADRAEDDTRPLWLVLIGHGTFDGKTAKFNLRGPDVTPTEIGDWLKRDGRPVAVINCASSSGPFLAELSGPGRVVITATKSGHEYNFARFGDYLSRAVGDAKADLDKDEQTSLLEAFVAASAGVREFYADDARLVTEHSLLDDNGDRLGTPADWFQGVRAVKAAKSGAPPDGNLARQFVLVRGGREQQLTADARARRDELEQELARARLRKTELDEDAYLELIEPLLVELARLYQQRKAE